MASPQLATLLQTMRSRPPVPADVTPEQMRQGLVALAAMMPTPPDVRRETVSAAGVPAEWVAAPGAAEERAILYLHGGGYVMGSIETHREMVSRLSRASGARGLVVDYRLAPEHPHPAALDDALAAYRWLLEQGGEPRRIVVAGDSAGGGLAVATLVAIRDAGLPLPAGGALLSPWVDLEGHGASMTSRAAEDPIVQREPLLALASLYLGGASPRTPLAAPLHADLRGLPPLLIQVGTAETLLDDASRLAEKARAAGVDVSYEPWEEMIHVWQLFAAMLPEGQQAIERIGEWTRKVMA